MNLYKKWHHTSRTYNIMHDILNSPTYKHARKEVIIEMELQLGELNCINRKLKNCKRNGTNAKLC